MSYFTDTVTRPNRRDRYSDPGTMKLAYENWRASSPSALDRSNRDDLLEALLNYESFDPCDAVTDQLNHDQAFSPSFGQLYRDRLVMDYLVTEKGYSVNDACDLWSGWEDYEFDLINIAK